MNSKEYEKMINNIKYMAPIESGVQTLVFWLLKDIVESTGNSIVVIDRMQKKSRFITYSGISDLAVVSSDFDYNSSAGKIIMCIEVKYIDVPLMEYKTQILGQLLTYKKSLVTNGKEWFYYDLEKHISDNCTDDIQKLWILNEINEIGKVIEQVVENNQRIAELRLSLSHIKKEEYKQVCRDEINKCKNGNYQLEPIIEDFITKNNWLTELLDNGTWKIDELIDKDGIVDNYKFLDLLRKLYDSFTEL